MKKDPVEDLPLLREAREILRTLVPGFEPTDWRGLKSGKSTVLLARDHGGQPLVAKRALARTIVVEHQVLEWLAQAPLPTIRSYGTAGAHTPDKAWLVSEFATGDPYRSSVPAHSAAAGIWLADLHVWSGSVERPALPVRGERYHQEVLRTARGTLTDALELGDALTADERRNIRRLVGASELVLDRWGVVQEILSNLPDSIVHSGFAGKNVRIDLRGTPRVYAFDWEQAGWGSAAADLSMVDVEHYLKQRAREGFPINMAPDVAAIGRVLWSFAGVPGERPSLLGEWPHRAARKLVDYFTRVDAALRVLGWRGP